MLLKIPSAATLRIYDAKKVKLASAIVLKNHSLLEVKEYDKVVKNHFTNLDNWAMKYSDAKYIAINNKKMELLDRYLSEIDVSVTPVPDMSGALNEISSALKDISNVLKDISGAMFDISGAADVCCAETVNIASVAVVTDMSGSITSDTISTRDMSDTISTTDMSGSADISGATTITVDVSGAKTITSLPGTVCDISGNRKVSDPVVPGVTVTVLPIVSSTPALKESVVQLPEHVPEKKKEVAVAQNCCCCQ